MVKRKRAPVSRPNALLYYGAGLFARFYYRWVYGLSVDRSAMAGIRPPFLAVAGHACWLDYMITSTALFPVRMNYVGAYNFFRDRILKPVMTLMGVIPKYQYTNDIAAVRKMKYVVDRGGVVGLFPHGCLSNEGRPGGFAAPGTAKLIKFLDVPVVAVRTHGGYLTRPRWTKKARRGRMETTVTPILTAREVRDLSEEEIYRRLLAAIDFDDYRWQREHHVPFRGRRLAEGVELVLYRCPKCDGEFTLRSQGNRLWCEACGNEAIMNRTLFFESGSPDSVIFDGIDSWYDYQRECLLEEIGSPDFVLKASTALQWAEPCKYGYQAMGHGSVTLTRDEVVYEGTVHGRPETLRFPMKDIPMVPYAAGEYIEIARGSDIRRFVFDDTRMMMKWVLAIRLIRDQYYE